MSGKEDLLKHAESLGLDPETAQAERQRAKPARSADAACRFAVACARIMRDDRCEDIVVLDLRGVSPVCDFFVIGNGTSERQMRAVIDHVKEMGKAEGEKPYSVGGYDESSWIVVDYVDVIVHLFNEEQRTYYDLDSLWGDSPKVEWAA